MQKVKITGHVWDYHFGSPSADFCADQARFGILSNTGPDSEPSDIRSYVGPISIEYEVPDSYNPTRSQLAALEKEKAKVRAAYLARVREIEDRISKLQALEFVEAA